MRTQVLVPDLYYSSVASIDLDALASEGIDTLLLDLDNTLLPRFEEEVPASIVAWTRELRDRGFRACLVSNNWHERVSRYAELLECDLIARALKPLPFGFMRAMKACGATRDKTAVVGDQIFTDIAGGNVLGLRTILVAPLSERDLPHTLLLRRLERAVLAGRTPVP